MIDAILLGDVRSCLKQLEDGSVQCVITSPPYWGLRDYGCDGQIGLEPTPEAYVADLVEVFREVKRVLRNDGVLWLNLGDSYAGSGRGRDADGTWNPGKGGSKQETNVGAITGEVVSPNCFSKLLIARGTPPGGYKCKDLVGIPWMVAFALRADGWYLRSDIIWNKPNPMPESVIDRCTKPHEDIFMLTKSERYYYDAEAIREGDTLSFASQGFKADAQAIRQSVGTAQSGGIGERGANPIYGRNKRDVWTVATQPCSEAHFATFPPKLIEPMILAGSKVGDTILDPFMGSGTTAIQAVRWHRHYLGCELNPEYVKMAERRIADMVGPLFVLPEVKHGDSYLYN